MLADVLLKIAAETQAPRDAHWRRPSAAGPERCIRSLVYHAAGVPAAPFPGRAIAVFDDGNWHAELVKDWIRRSAYKVHSEEMRVTTPVGDGSIDGIVTDLLNVDRLLENKSANHFSFERFWKGQFPQDYFTQCALYLAGLKKLNPDITEAVLLIKNKNTAALLEFRLAYDAPSDTLTLVEMVRSDGQRETPTFTMERVTQGAVEKFNLVEDYVRRKALPPRPFEVGDEFPCSYCSWGQECWRNYEEEFEALAEDPELDAEFETMAAYYLEVSGHASEMEKEKKELREKIRAAMEAKNLKGGKVGPYVITRSLRSREGLDEEMIPATILQAARTKTYFEVLNIRKPKPKGVK